MKNQKQSRRNWLKNSTLTLAGIAMMPGDVWANMVQDAQLNNRKYLFASTNTFNEFTPPVETNFKELSAILNANENPYGPPPKSAEAFQKEVFKGNRYPWQALSELREKIAAKENVASDQIIISPGSSDLLEKTAMVFYQRGGNVISADPSYMALISVSKAVGGEWKSYKLLDDSQHDLEAMEAAIDENTKLVYICNPNNPSGSITDAKKLREFCSRVSDKVPVFIDEAYIEISKNGLKDSMVSLVSEGKNVMIARTFSKIHGMAGLRIGYLVGKKETLDRINDIKSGVMGVSAPSIAAASASLDNQEFLDMSKTKIIEARDYTVSYLTDKKYVFLPSETNFLIFQIPMDGKEFLQKIYAKQVAVRSFTFWDKNWCRVSIGTMDEMRMFTQAMDEIFV